MVDRAAVGNQAVRVSILLLYMFCWTVTAGAVMCFARLHWTQWSFRQKQFDRYLDAKNEDEARVILQGYV